MNSWNFQLAVCIVCKRIYKEFGCDSNLHFDVAIGGVFLDITDYHRGQGSIPRSVTNVFRSSRHSSHHTRAAVNGSGLSHHPNWSSSTASTGKSGCTPASVCVLNVCMDVSPWQTHPSSPAALESFAQSGGKREGVVGVGVGVDVGGGTLSTKSRAPARPWPCRRLWGRTRRGATSPPRLPFRFHQPHIMENSNNSSYLSLLKRFRSYHLD